MARYLITLQKHSLLRLILSILVIIVLLTDLSAQQDTTRVKRDTIPDNFYLLQKVERNGIKMPEVNIKEVTVVPKQRSTAHRNEFRKYERLIYNIKTVYPYAKIVRGRLEQVNYEMMKLTSDKERREYLKTVEKGVFSEYEGDISQMTITQGRLLIKLIDRETQNTSFELIKQYRGNFKASFWQAIARIFGTNLKDEYDPWGDDAIIEAIIREIDAGAL